jgi:hypothetical protein
LILNATGPPSPAALPFAAIGGEEKSRRSGHADRRRGHVLESMAARSPVFDQLAKQRKNY